MRLLDDRVIARTPAELRLASRILLEQGRARRLLAFCMVDTHVHAVLACSRAEAGCFARTAEGSLRKRLHLPPFERARIRPVVEQSHLRAAVLYVLRQAHRHGSSLDPAHEGSSLPDLLGFRVLDSELPARLRAYLPRLRVEDIAPGLVQKLGALSPSLELLADAAAAAIGVASLMGRQPEVACRLQTLERLARDHAVQASRHETDGNRARRCLVEAREQLAVHAATVAPSSTAARWVVVERAAPDNPAMDQISPQVAERYRLAGVLGRGSGGVTYAGERLADGLPVAIKELDVSRVGEWKRLELFEREARVLAGLTHPGIPRYVELIRDELEGKPRMYLVQERARGRTLEEHVRYGWRADEPRVRQVAAELLRILVYLQSLSPPLVHRDIKPQNVIMTDDGTVSLVDFGGVRDQLRPGGEGSTVVGTYGYMAPEQFRGTALAATDLYGVGATLLFLLTHRAPADLPQRKLAIDFRPLVQVSPAFADWLERMIAPAPEDRFDSAKTALIQLLHPQPARARASSSRAALLGGALALVLVGGAAFVWWGEHTRPKPAAAPAPSATPPSSAQIEVKRGPRPAQTLSGHWSAVFGLAWTSDGSRLASGSFDQTAKLWDVRRAEVLRTFDVKGGKVGSLSITADDKLLIGAAGNTVRVWDLASGSEIRALPAHPTQVTSTSVSPDATRVAAASADGTVRVHELATGNAVHELKHARRVLSVAVTSRHVLTGGDDGLVRVFDLQSGRELRTLAGHQKAVGKLAVASDGQTVASGSDDGTVKVWAIEPGKLMRTLEHGATEVWSVTFAADGKTLASGTQDDVVRVWDAFSGRAITAMPGGLKGVISLVFSGDGRRLAAGGGNNLVHIWSLGDASWHPPLAAVASAAASVTIPASATAAERLTLDAFDRIDGYSGRTAEIREAKAMLERAIALDPRHARAHALLGRATYRIGYHGGDRYDPASLDAAHVHFDRALEIDPKLADAYVWKGFAYRFQKKPDLAREMAKKADALEPSSARAALLLAEMSVDTRDYDDAMRRVRAVIEGPHDPKLRSQAYSVLADVYRVIRDWEGMHLCYQSQINLEPQHPWPKGNYAAFLVRRGETDRAIEMAKAALEQMSYPAAQETLAKAYAQRATARVEAGKLDEAGVAAAEALKVDPTCAEAHLATGLHHRATAFATRDVARMAQAEASFRRAIALDDKLEAATVALAEHSAQVEKLRAPR
jgi:WD40 repeat protein/Tfp pilus assembly protein PilF